MNSCKPDDISVDLDQQEEVEEEMKGIEWDQSTLTKIADGNYARVKELDNLDLIAVYSRGNSVYVKYSKDRGRTWQNEQLIAEGNENYIMTNAEAIQLENKKIIVAFNRRVKDEYWDEDFTYGILIVSTLDYGETWTSPQLIYEAGNTNRRGCWEPALLQLPGGEVHCYFANEFPYQNSNEQEISLLRSSDDGENWSTEIETVCYASSARDGMPVAIIQGDNILLSIEDNSNGHVLQPSIIKESIEDNWQHGPVGANDERRTHLVPSFAQDRYAGAPYIAITINDELLLSFQDRLGRQRDNEICKVLLATNADGSFISEDIPFDISGDNHTKWNSLEVLSIGEIIVVTSTDAYQKGIYMITGTIENQ
tara:strand:- start:1245 stop:2345 length:1101 start_codon:yes stop_codon:yes gene_type:complete